MTFTQALATNNYGPAKFIVSSNPANGTHTSIGAALTSASSGDTIFIRPGTYIENPTLKAGVNLVAYDADALTPNVTINGKCTFTVAGTVSISGIQLQTNSDFALAVTGSAASIINLTQCFINALNNTAISFTSSSASAQIFISYCNGNIATTGIAYFANSSAGSMRILYSLLLNSGASTTANTVSAGSLFPNYTGFTNPITTSGTTAIIQGSHCVFNTNPQNVIPLTVNSTAANPSVLDWSEFNAGSASGVSIGAGATLKLLECVVMSTNTNAITGSGTIQYSALSFTNTSIINTTTQTALTTVQGITRSTLQPAFLAVHTIAQNSVTGAGAIQTVNFTTVIFDQNSNYDGTNTFTAPLTGRYQISSSVYIGSISAAMTASNIELVTSNRTYEGEICSAATRLQTGGNDASWHLASLADMDTADTCTVAIQIQNGVGNTANIPNTTTLTFFSGYLVC